MIFKTALAAVWVLAIGILCVATEIAQVQIGHRVQTRSRHYNRLLEEVRRLEIRYNRLVSPDILEKDFSRSQAAMARAEFKPHT